MARAMGVASARTVAALPGGALQRITRLEPATGQRGDREIKPGSVGFGKGTVRFHACASDCALVPPLLLLLLLFSLIFICPVLGSPRRSFGAVAQLQRGGRGDPANGPTHAA